MTPPHKGMNTSRLKSTTLTNWSWEMVCTPQPRDLVVARHHILWEVRRMGNVSTETADESLYKSAQNACI